MSQVRMNFFTVRHILAPIDLNVKFKALMYSFRECCWDIEVRNKEALILIQLFPYSCWNPLPPIPNSMVNLCLLNNVAMTQEQAFICPKDFFKIHSASHLWVWTTRTTRNTGQSEEDTSIFCVRWRHWSSTFRPSNQYQHSQCGNVCGLNQHFDQFGMGVGV